MSFQIGWVDKRQPSGFLKMGDTVPNTKFRLMAFQFKTQPNPRTGDMSDVSELMLTNTETNESFVLVKRQPVDSPPVF